MHHGEVLQSGSPEEVFSQPRSELLPLYRRPEFFPGQFPDQNGIAKINENISITISGQGEHREGYVLIRKEDIFLSSGEVETSAVNHFRGVIRDIIPTSVGYEVIVDIGIPVYSLITATSLANLSLREGGLCYVHFKASAVRFIEA
jgi:molybdopterin-binding protein